MYQWPTNWGSSTKKPAAFGDFVTMRGGEYFFAPSLSMLKSLRPSAPIVVKHPNILDDLRLSLGPLFPHLQVLDPVLQLFVPDPVDTGAGVGPTSLAPA
jgi:hypothetical protein